jgi:hypothetical protein
MESLMHAYDLAKDGERDTGWIRYCGARLGVASDPDGQVYVWDTTAPTDREKMFEIDELTVKQFMTAVEEWVHEEVTEETIEA